MIQNYTAKNKQHGPFPCLAYSMELRMMSFMLYFNVSLCMYGHLSIYNKHSTINGSMGYINYLYNNCEC